MKTQKIDARKLINAVSKEKGITKAEAFAIISNEQKQTLKEMRNYLGTTEITFEISNRLLERINKRITEKKYADLKDYFTHIAVLDLGIED